VKTIALIAALSIVAAAWSSASGLPSVTPPAKQDPGVIPPVGELQGGDTIETAVPIPELPYFTTGTTAGYNNDYDEMCPYDSNSPDVVYQFTPYSTAYVDIWTCESAYDTKIFVYENEYTPGSPYACNDDSSDCPGPPYRSWIPTIPLREGNTYYIVIDGYGGDFGDYLLTVEEVSIHELCDVDCPPGAFDEGEPDCHSGYIDETDPGCNVLPPVFQHPGLNTYVCGTSGNYNGNTWRDVDWFEVTLTETKTLNWCVCAGFEAWICIIDGREGCDGAYVMAETVAPAEVLSCATHELGAGTYWFVVSTNGWIGVPCGSEYVASLFEGGYSPVESSSWGMIKAEYRE
jgi:hypothetical protein